MTVKELKTLIDTLPDNIQVIIQKDVEGNDFSPLADVDTDAIYIPKNTWSGDVYYNAEYCNSEEEWNEIKDNPKVLILYPVN